MLAFALGSTLFLATWTKRSGHLVRQRVLGSCRRLAVGEGANRRGHKALRAFPARLIVQGPAETDCLKTVCSVVCVTTSCSSWAVPTRMAVGSGLACHQHQRWAIWHCLEHSDLWKSSGTLIVPNPPWGQEPAVATSPHQVIPNRTAEPTLSIGEDPRPRLPRCCGEARATPTSRMRGRAVVSSSWH